MAVEGSLDSVDIQDVVQLLNVNRSTGILHISSPSNSGKLYYRDGEIIEAKFESMSGEAAAYVLLSQQEGDFRFEMTQINDERVIQRTIHDLVLEAARRKDTIGRIRSTIGHDNIIFLPLIDVRIPKLAEGFSETEITIMKALDGQADIRTVTQKLNKSAFDVLYNIFELEQKGQLKRVEIYKVLEVGLLKKLFGRGLEVQVSNALMEDWKRESMVFAACETVEIRTRQATYGQASMSVKPNIPPEHILMGKELLQRFEVSVGDKVLVKPILYPD